jgi:hypothetical protein
MTATINASTTAGVVTTADTSGILQLQTNGTAALTIDASQRTAFVAGTAALPAITTTGDTNTGIFFPAADTVGVATGGSERVRVDSSGNVGIGTSSPASKLDISDTSANSLRISGAGDHALGFTGYSGNSATQIFSIRNDGNSNVYINTQNSVPLNFGVSTGTTFGSTTSHMRIDSNGRVMINQTAGATTNTVLEVKGIASAVLSRWQIGTDGFKGFQFVNAAGATEVGSIVINNASTTYATSSDYRLKEDITPMKDALTTVAALKPVAYKWKATGEATQGFIAHELQAIVPECVVGEKDAVQEEQYEVTPAVKDEEGNTITEAVMGTRTVPAYQGIDTSFLVATLTAAIQEQQALITALTTRITALESN